MNFIDRTNIPKIHKNTLILNLIIPNLSALILTTDIASSTKNKMINSIGTKC